MRSHERGAILRVMANVCSERLKSLDEDLCSLIISVAISEMTAAKEIDEQWQQGEINSCLNQQNDIVQVPAIHW